MDVAFSRGRLWYGPDAKALGGATAGAAIDPAEVLERRLPRAGAAPAHTQFAALRSACPNASGGSYFVMLGAELRGAAGGCLAVQVAVDRLAGVDRFERPLAEIVLASACEAAPAIAGAGTLRFAWALVHPVDRSPLRYARAARALTRLLGQALATLSPERVARDAAALWGAGSAP